MNMMLEQQESPLTIGPALYGDIAVGAGDPYRLCQLYPDTVDDLLATNGPMRLMIDFSPELLQEQAIEQLHDLDRSLRAQHSVFSGCTLGFSWSDTTRPDGARAWENTDVMSSFTYQGVPIAGPYDASISRPFMLEKSLVDKSRVRLIRDIVWAMADMHNTVAVIGFPMPTRRYDSPTLKLLNNELGAQFFEVPEEAPGAVFSFILATGSSKDIEFAPFFDAPDFRQICGRIYNQLHNIHFKQFVADALPSGTIAHRGELVAAAARRLLFGK